MNAKTASCLGSIACSMALCSSTTGCGGAPYLQQVPVSSVPPNAHVQVDCFDANCSSRASARTPTQVELDRTRDHVVTVHGDGYEDQQVVLKSHYNGWSALGNFLVGFGFGFGVVAGYGAANPDGVTVDSKKGLGPTLEVAALTGLALGGINLVVNGIYGATTRRDTILSPGEIKLTLERPRSKTPAAAPSQVNQVDINALHKLDEARGLFRRGDREQAESLLLGTYQACGELCKKTTTARLSLLMGAVHQCRDASQQESINAYSRALELDPDVRWDETVGCEPARATFDSFKATLRGTPAPAVSGKSSPVIRATQLIEQHQVDAAETLIDDTLQASHTDLSNSTLAGLWLLRGVIASDYRKQPLMAREAFEKALELDKNATIDESVVHQQTLDILEATREKHRDK
jgi:hypothetical protein